MAGGLLKKQCVMRQLTGVLLATMAAGATAGAANAQDLPDKPPGWDREKAAQYLDDRMDAWFDKATTLEILADAFAQP
jgi:hypothetical protein